MRVCVCVCCVGEASGIGVTGVRGWEVLGVCMCMEWERVCERVCSD